MIENLDTIMTELPNGSTLSDSLKRIKLLRNILSALGYALGLDLTNSSTSDPDAENVSTLEQVVTEFNSIVKRSSIDKEEKLDGDTFTYILDKNEKIEIPAGYYSEAFNIGGYNYAGDTDLLIEDLKKHIANTTKDQVVNGYEIPVIFENSDGTLTISYDEGTLGSEGSPILAGNKDSKGNLILTTSAGDNLTSKIRYNEGGDIEVKIDVKEGATLGDNPEDVTVNEINQLPGGYYASDINILPVLNVGKEATNKVINVEAGKVILVTNKTLSLTPTKGFDYIKNGSINVQEGSVGTEISTSGRKITITPSITEGWVDSLNVTKATGDGATVTRLNDNWIVTLPSVENDETEAQLIATTIQGEGETPKEKVVVRIEEGYYEGGASGTVDIPVTFNNNEIKISSSSEIIVDEDTAVNELDGTYVVDVIPANTPTLITSPLKISLDKTNLVFANTGSASAKSLQISDQTSYVKIAKGYTKGEEIKISVKSASNPELTTNENNDKIVVKIASEGWIDSLELDVTNAFIGLSDRLVDTDGGTSVEEDPNDPISSVGQALFVYEDDLDEITNGIELKVPSEGSRYFNSAKVDLSALITTINNI